MIYIRNIIEDITTQFIRITSNIMNNFTPRNLANYNQKGKFFLRHKQK